MLPGYSRMSEIRQCGFCLLLHIHNNPTSKLTLLFHFIDEKTEADIE